MYLLLLQVLEQTVKTPFDEVSSQKAVQFFQFPFHQDAYVTNIMSLTWSPNWNCSIAQNVYLPIPHRSTPQKTCSISLEYIVWFFTCCRWDKRIKGLWKAICCNPLTTKAKYKQVKHQKGFLRAITDQIFESYWTIRKRRLQDFCWFFTQLSPMYQ